jgi:glyoxylase I family protein
MKAHFAGIHHGSFLVADLEKSLRFYCDLLGMRINDSRPDLPFLGAWLNVGNEQQIHLLQLDNPDPTSNRPEHGGRDRHLALWVEDMQPILMMLDDNEIPYTLSQSGRLAVFFRDPDANTLELVEVPKHD